jgi:mono/diheme cytochrome c family protein
MARPRTRTLLAAALLVAAAAVAACDFGSRGIEVAENDPTYEGAVIFSQKCSGCHSFSYAGSEGSAVDANGREYKDGPNFDERREDRDQVLYAIRNGGFSSGPMPQNIVVGEEAEKVAEFVAKFAGRKAGD